MWGGVQTALCCLRFFTDDRGRTVVERGLDHVRGGFVAQQLDPLPGDLRRGQRMLLLLLQHSRSSGSPCTPTPGPRTTMKRSYFNERPLRRRDRYAMPRSGSADADQASPASSTPTVNSSFRRAPSCRRPCPSNEASEMSGHLDGRHVHLDDRLVEIDIVQVAAQLDGVSRGDDDVGERHRGDQQGRAEIVDALDDVAWRAGRQPLIAWRPRVPAPPGCAAGRG